MRTKLVAANWKMFGSRSMTDTFLRDLSAELTAFGSGFEVLICPPALYVQQAAEVASSLDFPIKIGAQNVHAAQQGAFTGELSCQMISDCDAHYVIVGHSERRALFGETDSIVAEKFLSCVEHSRSLDKAGGGLTPVLCVGETIDQRRAGATEAVIEAQLTAVVEAAGIDAFSTAVIAYEPVWAIGTGETASPEQAQEIHSFIRAMLGKMNHDIAANIRILYGGSVKPSNAAQLFSQADIDGGLVGGASLKVQDFAGICKAAANV